MGDRDGTDKFAPETARGSGTAWSDHGEVPAMQLNQTSFVTRKFQSGCIPVVTKR